MDGCVVWSDWGGGGENVEEDGRDGAALGDTLCGCDGLVVFVVVDLDVDDSVGEECVDDFGEV